MALEAVQVFEGDGVDYGPIRISHDPLWRTMRVMYSTRKHGEILVPEEKFCDYPIEISLTTKVQKKNITTLLIARNVEISMYGDRENDVLRYCRDRFKKDRKLFNMFLTHTDQNNLVKMLYCKGCKIDDLITYHEMCEYQDTFMRAILTAQSVMPINDIEAFFTKHPTYG